MYSSKPYYKSDYIYYARNTEVPANITRKPPSPNFADIINISYVYGTYMELKSELRYLEGYYQNIMSVYDVIRNYHKPFNTEKRYEMWYNAFETVHENYACDIYDNDIYGGHAENITGNYYLYFRDNTKDYARFFGEGFEYIVRAKKALDSLCHIFAEFGSEPSFAGFAEDAILNYKQNISNVYKMLSYMEDVENWIYREAE
jgi:hypothetical protein